MLREKYVQSFIRRGQTKQAQKSLLFSEPKIWNKITTYVYKQIKISKIEIKITT